MGKEKNPTIAEIIAYLEKFPKDTEVVLSVKDYYSSYGVDSKFENFDTASVIWNHRINLFGQLALNVVVNKKEGKRPKITFIK